ncbi:conserved protein of unknown function [Methylocaldum szegediense]|uniref:Lipoprotein n=1 Tax=Methylocaldum szegediense TaxID=73780 RepID=A0ABM9I1V9_9GAMM|nr:conserved protein of unknown function [Methylocaldum szegediense]
MTVPWRGANVRYKRVLVFLATIVLSGCAVSPKQYPEALPAYRLSEKLFEHGPYGRNGIVCTPSTIVGHLVGGATALAVLPLYIVGGPIDYGIGLARSSEQPPPVASALSNVSWAFGTFAGAIAGTPFLPFSYLADQHQCKRVILY